MVEVSGVRICELEGEETLGVVGTTTGIYVGLGESKKIRGIG